MTKATATTPSVETDDDGDRDARRTARDAWVRGLGRVLVVAPHPDDETIGCGGLLALCARLSVDADVVLISDGAMSHPRSRRHDAPARARVRLEEMRAALGALGLDGATRLHVLGCRDGDVPAPGDARAVEVVERLIAVAEPARGATWFVPDRDDGHRDHRASFALAWAAAARLAPRALYEYPVWAAAPPNVDARPRVRLDVTDVRRRKAEALAAHASQLGRVFVDDPDGFVLPREFIERSAGAADETYFGPADAALTR